MHWARTTPGFILILLAAWVQIERMTTPVLTRDLARGITIHDSEKTRTTCLHDLTGNMVTCMVTTSLGDDPGFDVVPRSGLLNCTWNWMAGGYTRCEISYEKTERPDEHYVAGSEGGGWIFGGVRKAEPKLRFMPSVEMHIEPFEVTRGMLWGATLISLAGIALTLLGH